MRIFPIVLIAVGVFGLLKHYGLIDPALLHLGWPLLLIGIGVALLARGPRARGAWREHREDRWERRMHRHFGPGWANLSEAERERFRAGMRQWRDGDDAVRGDAAPPSPAADRSSHRTPTQPPAPGDPR